MRKERERERERERGREREGERETQRERDVVIVGDASELRPPYPPFRRKIGDSPYPFGKSPIN
jgi:hypothetical protein